MYFNSSQYTVKYRSKVLSLYPKEFILLHFLYGNRHSSMQCINYRIWNWFLCY